MIRIYLNKTNVPDVTITDDEGKEYDDAQLVKQALSIAGY